MPTTRRQPRADAERNRQALLDAAASVFGRRGLDAPLDEIAQAADLGNATLYRHFPSRCALVTAVFTQQMTVYAEAARLADAEPDAWSGLCRFVSTIGALQAQSRGLSELLVSTSMSSPELDHLRQTTQRLLRGVIARAQEAGSLRPDFTAEDVALILMANAGVVRRTASCAPESSPRLISLVLQGLSASATPSSSPPPPSARRMLRAMQEPLT